MKALAILAIICILYFLELYIGQFHNDSLILLTIMLVLVTAVLAWVAYSQIHMLNKTAKADFLLRLDERYCSREILKARRIIVKLGYSRYKSSRYNSQTLQQFHDKMEEIRENKEKHSKKYTYLLNLLDFLETISHFKIEGNLEDNDFNELFGEGVLPSYHKAFEPWLKFFKEEEPNRYRCFIKLATERKNHSHSD